MNVKRVLMAPAAAAIAVAAIVTGGGAALAAGPVNPSFETGDTTGWTEVLGDYGSAGVESGQGLPGMGTFSGAVYGGEKDVPTELRQSVSLAVGETISGWVRFRDNDGCSYNDGAALIVDGPGAGDEETLFAASGCSTGSTEWTEWTFTATVAGTHTIIGQSWNGGDSAVASVLLLDEFLEFDGFTRAWIFGDCEGDGECRGFGVIIGNISSTDDLRNAILVALGDSDLYGPYIVKAYAFKVGAQFVPPVMFSSDEGSCEEPSQVPGVVAGDRDVLTADQSAGTGFWLTWFEIGYPCESEPVLQAEQQAR